MYKYVCVYINVYLSSVCFLHVVPSVMISTISEAVMHGQNNVLQPRTYKNKFKGTKKKTGLNKAK